MPAAHHTRQQIRQALAAGGARRALWAMDDSDAVAVAAGDLKAGMCLNLSGERLSDPDHANEYAQVIDVELWDNTSVLVHTNAATIVFPAAHHLRVDASSAP